jgi:hypothetical protein
MTGLINVKGVIMAHDTKFCKDCAYYSKEKWTVGYCKKVAHYVRRKNTCSDHKTK